jgi:AraC family transcriptional regulator
MQLNIKNMVCARCIKTVKNIFESAGAGITNIQLGVVELKEPLEPATFETIRKELEAEGFEILDDQRIKLTEQIKKLIIELVHYKDLEEMKENLSGYLSRQVHKDYTYLSNLFSSIENITIEQYFIQQKIEKVKEWLVYNELTLAEMAYRLSYSSVAHLSSQFKKITGFTPTEFKKLKEHNRKQLDKL